MVFFRPSDCWPSVPSHGGTLFQPSRRLASIVLYSSLPYRYCSAVYMEVTYGSDVISHRTSEAFYGDIVAVDGNFSTQKGEISLPGPTARQKHHHPVLTPCCFPSGKLHFRPRCHPRTGRARKPSAVFRPQLDEELWLTKTELHAVLYGLPKGCRKSAPGAMALVDCGAAMIPVRLAAVCAAPGNPAPDTFNRASCSGRTDPGTGHQTRTLSELRPELSP